MCGIAGIVAPDASRHREALERMIATLRPRGPDGEGAYTFDGCTLGHTRLSIVDLAGGAQPMVDADGRTAVVFNGEIYGYKDLRQTMHGYPFRTLSDTEVLLALYERDGESMLDRLPGMFAFALWDDRRRELFCARDRFGEKPFFYTLGRDGAFVFASELKAIVASGLVEPEIDRSALAHYLRYLYVHPHRTIYRNIHTLPPGHRLRYDGREVEVSRYWTLPAPDPHIGLDEAVERFRQLLTQAVARQLVADVPVGAFLSGGLDSSTLVALAARASGRCKTFSFGFGPVIDELPFARGIADRYGTEHVELTDTDSRIADLIVRMATVFDEPFADSSNIPTFLLCGQARKEVTVALTGEGADELLGGYTFWYRALFDMDDAGRRSGATQALARLVAAASRRAGWPAPEWAGRGERGRLLRRQYATVGEAHAARAEYFCDADIEALVPGAKAHPAPPRPAASSLDEVLRSDLVTYLPGDILVKADRASMAHGLELRAPFLDWEFASFCVSLPMQLKITHDRDKVVLREAFADTWTPAIRSRDKQGFGAPVSQWLAGADVRALRGDLLGNRRSRIYELIPFEAAERLTRADDYRTWALLVLGVWMESARQTGPSHLLLEPDQLVS